MNSLKISIGATLLVALVAASPTLPSNFLEMRSPCNNLQDPLGCLQMKAWNFISSIFNKDTFKLSNYIKINRNTYSDTNNYARSVQDSTLENRIEEFIKCHSVNVNLPGLGTMVEMEARNLDSGEIDLKINFAEGSEGRKSKLKKIAAPIIAFVLLKAIILIPLALGIIGLKVWNALQLSFVSFVATLALAVYQLCKKITDDNVPIAAHVAYEGPYRQKRSIDQAQELAYNAYKRN